MWVDLGIIKMPLQYKNIPEWTEEDQEEVIRIQEHSLELFKYFLKGFSIGVGFLILLKIIDWWGLFNQIGVFLR